MISHDLELAGGYCGSKSGMIYVTVVQPTIKISKILKRESRSLIVHQ